MARRLVKVNPEHAIGVREYHLMMYHGCSWYRTNINAKIPGGKLPDCAGLKWVGRAKIIDDATIVWNFLRCSDSYEFEKIQVDYLEYKERLRLHGW
jgi:hypothetical protein